MAIRKPKVVVTRKLPDPVETRMRELFDTELNLEDAPLDAAGLAAALKRAEVLVPTITDRIDAAAIAAGGRPVERVPHLRARASPRRSRTGRSTRCASSARSVPAQPEHLPAGQTRLARARRDHHGRPA